MQLAKRIYNKLKTLALRFMNPLVPKQANRMVFTSLPDFSDNAKGFWEYVKKAGSMELIWLVRDESLAMKLRAQGIDCRLLGTLPGVRAVLSARYLVCTHSQFIDIKCKSQVLVNLWHGMPLKAMGYLDSLCTEKDLQSFELASRKTDIFIATSLIMKYIMTSCFHIDARKVRVTGQPRNDQLFNPVNQQLAGSILGEKASGHARYILYCPTFRVGMGRVEGNRSNANVFNLPDYDRDVLDHLLKQANALLVVKLHPFEEKQLAASDLNLPENAVLVQSEAFNRHSATIYDLLNLFDMLITDYSSIYFDFLLLDRPMLFLATDLEEYRGGRGIVFEDYSFWTPGPKAEAFSSFAGELAKCLEDPTYYGKERALVNSLINSHRDGASAARLLDLLQKPGN